MPKKWVRPVLRSIAGVVMVLSAAAGARAGEPLCPPDPPLAALSLPHLRAVLEAGRPATIVALGSSSTQGVMASGPEEAYPAELADALQTALPGRRITVLNQGIGGEDVGRESARLDRSVFAHRPQAVIWQVGANAALHGADPARFRRLVTAGIRRMRARGIDVVLMDNQRSPRLLASPQDGVFDRLLAEVAQETGATLFSRDRLMRGWAREGDPPAEFIATDSLHHNDRGYACVARALARRILDAVGAPVPPRLELLESREQE